MDCRPSTLRTKTWRGNWISCASWILFYDFLGLVWFFILSVGLGWVQKSLDEELGRKWIWLFKDESAKHYYLQINLDQGTGKMSQRRSKKLTTWYKILHCKKNMSNIIIVWSAGLAGGRAFFSSHQLIATAMQLSHVWTLIVVFQCLNCVSCCAFVTYSLVVVREMQEKKSGAT